MVSAILALLGPVLKFLVGWWTKKNSEQIVKRAEANNIQVNTDEIRQLIHQYHFPKSEWEKNAALAELRRRGAMT
jgi:hypothetical protein